jgi:hypothetical protein
MTNKNNYPPDSCPIAYGSLEEAQPTLLDFYTGDYKEFADLICVNCKHVAINPKDCGKCSELIC